MKIVISSGHGKIVRGASGYLDEVDEARLVVERVAALLRRSQSVTTFHDDVSDDQSENLNRIVNFHNAQGKHDLDISVHFNAYDGTASGTECLYVTQGNLSEEVAAGIAHVAGFKNRGAKYRDDLFFLNNTNAKAILIEVCFCDSQVDAELYHASFDEICETIAEVVSGVDIEDAVPPEEVPPPVTGALFMVRGRASTFGGPLDEGVSDTEGLAFISSVEQAPQLFLPGQPQDTYGLARRLNPYVHYVACRWDYNVTPKAQLREMVATVRAIKTGITLKAFPADWGPHQDTGRVADLSPCLMDDLGIKTDDEVEVIIT